MRFYGSRRRHVRRPYWRVAFDWIGMTLFCGVIVLIIVRLEHFAAKQLVGMPTIIDGDSIVLQGIKLRLEGIDAPEITQLCKKGTSTYPCGREAVKYLTQLVNSQAVECRGWQRDRYGRLLVRCSVVLQQMNRQMVSAGWAVAYGDYLGEEATARSAKRGVWQGEFERPSNWRKTRGDMSEVPHDLWLKITSFWARLFRD